MSFRGQTDTGALQDLKVHIWNFRSCSENYLACFGTLGVKLDLLSCQLSAGVHVIAQVHTTKSTLAQQFSSPPVYWSTRSYKRTVTISLFIILLGDNADLFKAQPPSYWDWNIVCSWRNRPEAFCQRKGVSGRTLNRIQPVRPSGPADWCPIKMKQQNILQRDNAGKLLREADDVSFHQHSGFYITIWRDRAATKQHLPTLGLQ